MRSLALGLRFLMELVALIAFGLYAWETFEGVYRWVGVIGLPLSMMALWGVFNVPGDPSRGGGAPIPVSGIVRLGIEVMFFGAAVAALAMAVSVAAGLVFLVGIVVAYALMTDRLRWLLSQPSPHRR